MEITLEEISLLYITVEIHRCLKEKYSCGFHVYNTQKKKEIYVLKEIYLYSYKKIYSLRKSAVVFINVIIEKIFIK